ncbi:MAG TPA: hypothetical protein VET48_12185, partial [Steroidobacteraceae bacterium]|nr:hypothetical protein [Steroidobacteraceae bacterium]
MSLSLFAHMAMAGTVEGLTTFMASTPARASEVNANFTAVKTAVDDNHNRIGSLLTRLANLEASVTTLQTQVTTLQDTVQSQASTITTLQNTVQTQSNTISTLQSQLTNITPLNGVVSLSSQNGVPTVRFTNVNVQVVNGLGSTSTINGAGNLLIGYNEARGGGLNICSV